MRTPAMPGSAPAVITFLAWRRTASGMELEQAVSP